MEIGEGQQAGRVLKKEIWQSAPSSSFSWEVVKLAPYVLHRRRGLQPRACVRTGIPGGEDMGERSVL